jgi:putative ABC transport system permease protein
VKRWIEDARRDLAYAARTLIKAPGFTAASLLTLALGIASVTLIYSVVYNVRLNPLPYRDSDRLVNVFVLDTETGRARTTFRAAEFVDLRDQADVFEDVIGTFGEATIYAAGDRAEVLRAVRVTPNFFDFMGLAPLLGRTITLEDGRPDTPAVAVLRYRAWMTYFGGDPGVVGRTVTFDGTPRTIVGVMPPRFTWHAADLWIPDPLDRYSLQSGDRLSNFQARLKPGVSTKQAEAQLTAIAARRAPANPNLYPQNFRVQVLNVIEYTVGQFSGVLYTTLAAVGLLMLIACCNVANMLLARATTREREMTVRAALGASRNRIIRQLLVESLLLSVAGAAVGCFIAYLGLDTLVSYVPQGPLPGEVVITLNASVLTFSFVTALIAAVLFGTAPALYAARRDLTDGLKGAGKNIAVGRGRVGTLLVPLEIAVSVVLLVGAGLLVRSFVALARTDLGFNPQNVLVVPLFFSPNEPLAPADKHRFYEAALQRIASLPGVEAAAATTAVPPYSGLPIDLDVPGRPRVGAQPVVVQLSTERYFETLGVTIVRGRGLPAADPSNAPRAAVVNEAFVRRYFAGEDPIGRQIRMTLGGKESDPLRHGTFQVVGVVRDVRNDGLREPPAPHAYFPGATIAGGAAPILVRTTGDPVRSLNAVRAEISSIDRRVAVRQPDSLPEMLNRMVYAQPRFSLIVIGLFAATGTVLVAIGVFGVMAYTVSRQKREIAVRMALGAARNDVLAVVLGRGARLLVGGIAAGVCTSLVASRLLRSQLWDVSPYDPLSLSSAVALIAVVAMAACSIPALRAIRIEPMTALRQE